VSRATRLHFTHGDHAAALDLSNLRLDYWAGEIFAMSGGTPEHSVLATMVMSLLRAKIPSGCHAFNSDTMIRIEAADATVFPDGSVACGKVERWRFENKIAIRNPGLIVEVTSPSTEDYDRGAKLDAYKTIPTLQAVWLVSHDEPLVTVVERQKRGWRSTKLGSGKHLTLATPALTVDVDAIYAALQGL
jgi:Uma2 family endonuclease